MEEIIPLDDLAFKKIRDLVSHIRETGEGPFTLGFLDGLYEAFDMEVLRRYSGYEGAFAAGLKPDIKDYGLEPQDTRYVACLRSGDYPD